MKFIMITIILLSAAAAAANAASVLSAVLGGPCSRSRTIGALHHRWYTREYAYIYIHNILKYIIIQMDARI